MDPAFVLVALIVASLPFVLPIISLVRQSRLSRRLAELENALDDQKHTIDDLRRGLAQLKKEGAPAIPRPVVTPPPVTQPAAAPPAPPRVPATRPVPPPAPPSIAPPSIAPPDVPPTPPPDIWRDLMSGPVSLLKGFDWEQLVGVKLFSAVAGIALVLAAIFFLRYSMDRGWLSPAVRVTIGIVVATALLVVCELRAAYRYRVTANALDAAAIAIEGRPPTRIVGFIYQRRDASR